MVLELPFHIVPQLLGQELLEGIGQVQLKVTWLHFVILNRVVQHKVITSFQIKLVYNYNISQIVFFVQHLTYKF